jgi:small membrane protein
MIIRALLLAALAATGYLVFLRRNKLPFHIVLVFLLLGLGAAAVLAPEQALDDIANAFGVGRGVDLITYLFEAAALFVLLHYYTKFVELQRQLTQMTREVAILRGEVERLTAAQPPQATDAAGTPAASPRAERARPDPG